VCAPLKASSEIAFEDTRKSSDVAPMKSTFVRGHSIRLFYVRYI
jgi:hypothetical protein